MLTRFKLLKIYIGFNTGELFYSIMKEQFDFYAYISRMKYIVRWGLMRNTDSENIQEHSLQVAVLAHALAVIHNKLCPQDPLSPERACLYGVFHDASEIITGDLPTPIKYYNPVIKDNYQAIEDIAKDKLLSKLVYKEIKYILLPCSMEMLSKRLGKSGNISAAALIRPGFEKIIFKCMDTPTVNCTNIGKE